MSRNAWLMQFLADQCQVPVERPAVTETTALGAALLAGMAIGEVAGIESLPWHAALTLVPQESEAVRVTRHTQWLKAVARARSTES
jgi:glycerol kinase